MKTKDPGNEVVSGHVSCISFFVGFVLAWAFCVNPSCAKKRFLFKSVHNFLILCVKRLCCFKLHIASIKLYWFIKYLVIVL